MANNTLFQYITHIYNAIVTGNAVVGAGAVLNDLKMTGGTFTANGTSAVTVVEPTITANSCVDITLKTPGGTVGAVPAITTITPGTGFTVVAAASDTSIYNYLVTG